MEAVTLLFKLSDDTILCFAVSLKTEMLFCSFVHVLKIYFGSSLFFYERAIRFLRKKYDKILHILFIMSFVLRFFSKPIQLDHFEV